MAILPLLIAALSAAGCGGTGIASTPTTLGPTTTSTPATGRTPTSSSTRDHLLTRTTLGPWWGSGCPRAGDCGCGSSETLAEEFTCQLDELRSADIPVSVYLFDGSGWSEGDSRQTGTCEGEGCCSWALGDEVIERLAREHVRALVHSWGGCHEASQYARVHAQLGGSLLGFYLDDGSSDAELQRANDYMRSVSPGDFENIAKTFQSREPSTSDAGISRLANVSYVADLANNFEGLREGIARVLQKAHLLPAPVNELTGYDFDNPLAPEEETFFRRIHWGAFQPIMAHTPFGNSDPWRAEFSSDLLTAYRYYGWLHKELTPYFLSYARRMHETPTLPIMKAGPSAYTMQVGDEIFVPLVVDPLPEVDFTFPTGQWVDYWDESQVLSGKVVGHPVPRGQEPVFFKLGSIIPLEVERDYTGHGTRESQGSLTLLVFPSGTSTFRYNDDDNGKWTTFKSVLDGDKLTLSTDTAARMPLLYRVARMAAPPASIKVAAQTVSINQGGTLPQLDSESEVNESTTNAWYYDAATQHLIIKVFP